MNVMQNWFNQNNEFKFDLISKQFEIGFSFCYFLAIFTREAKIYQFDQNISASLK
jgi:hypothetical protein